MTTKDKKKTNNKCKKLEHSNNSKPTIMLRHSHSINPNMADRLGYYHWNKTKEHNSLLLQSGIHLKILLFISKSNEKLL